MLHIINRPFLQELRKGLDKLLSIMIAIHLLDFSSLFAQENHEKKCI